MRARSYEHGFTLQPFPADRMTPPSAWCRATKRKQLHQGDNRFCIDLRFACQVPRVVHYGSSGSGKTQTLRMVAGIAAPNAGRVAVGNRVLFDADSDINLELQSRWRCRCC